MHSHQRLFTAQFVADHRSIFLMISPDPTTPLMDKKANDIQQKCLAYLAMMDTMVIAGGHVYQSEEAKRASEKNQILPPCAYEELLQSLNETEKELNALRHLLKFHYFIKALHDSIRPHIQTYHSAFDARLRQESNGIKAKIKMNKAILCCNRCACVCCCCFTIWSKGMRQERQALQAENKELASTAPMLHTMK